MSRVAHLSSTRRRGRAREALRPVGMRPVGPDVDFLHVADVAALDVLESLARVVERVPLVAHLGGDLGLGRLLRQGAGLVHRPAQRLLHVDVLAERHRRHGDRRVGVVGRRDDDAVDVLLLRQHLAVVLVALRLAGLGDQGLDVGGTPLGGLQPGRGRHRAAGALRRRRVRVGLERRRSVCAPARAARTGRRTSCRRSRNRRHRARRCSGWREPSGCCGPCRRRRRRRR